MSLLWLDSHPVCLQAEYIEYQGFAGAMLSTLDYDDFHHNLCQQGYYPLLSAVKAELIGQTSSDKPTPFMGLAIGKARCNAIR